MDRVAAPVAAVVVAALLVLSAAAPVLGQSVAVAPDSVAERPAAVVEQRTATIEKHVELFLTPDEPGRIDVVVGYRLPDAVSSLSVSLPDRTTAVETSDFEETPDDYEWGGDGDTAQLRVTVDANRTATGSRAGADSQADEYSFVDAGDWALVTVPTMRTGWGWSGPEDLTVDLTQSTTVDGEGSTGGEVAYLGPVTEHTRDANGQTFTLAVPDRASLAERPADVLDALEAASGRMQVGDRDDEVWMGVAPTDAGWGVRGVEYGGNDAWVLADARLDEPANVWLHEYVHTRQDYTTESSGRWTMEAAAEYYAASLSLELGYVGFDDFRQYLAYGDRDPWRDAVLATPSTWSTGANYLKGGLVWGELDRRVRLATNQTASMDEVLYALNRQDPDVSNEDVVAAVRSTAGDDPAAAAERFTTSDASPSMWSSSDHTAAFDTEPPRMTYSERQYRVSGPFRNETFAGPPPTLYVGETLIVTASVTNEGGVPGTYEVSLDRDGATLATDSGPLDADESGRVAVEHTVETPGTYNLTVGRDGEQVTARSPSTLRVADLAVEPDRVEPGETVVVTATLSNPSEHPATGSVTVALDGRSVGTLNATLAAGGTTIRSTTVTLTQSRRYEVSAGDRTVSARASEPDASVPGLGLAGAVVVVAVTASALAARRRR
jgi:hypothetical protein